MKGIESADKPGASGRDSPYLQALQTIASYRLYHFLCLFLYQLKRGKRNIDVDPWFRTNTRSFVFCIYEHVQRTYDDMTALPCADRDTVTDSVLPRMGKFNLLSLH